MRYSNTTKSFYPDEIVYANLPTDLTVVSNDDWVAAVEALNKGETFNFDTDGVLTIIPRPAELVKLDAIAKIKQEAGNKINAVLPQYKQLNLLSRALELTLLVASGGTLSETEQNELTAIKAKWDQIKAIRLESNAKEAALP